MKFNEFLDTLLPTYNVLPSQKLKDDLATFKSAFNYANKTDDIYNDLIDNIVKLLRIKFGEYEIIYSSPLVMYNELLITLNPQLPQFLMIQKKQLIETLNTFGDLQNWGDVLKDNVRKALNLSDTNSNATSYVPFDGVDKDPYSVNDVNGQREVNETTDYNRLATDYLNFYKKIRWNIASIELNKIYQDYIKLFKIYYNYNGFSNQYNSEWAAQIRDNTDNIAILAEEIDKTNYNVGVNTSNIVANSNRIDMTNNNLATNYYDKTTADTTFGSLAQQTTNTQNIADLTNRVGANETNITSLTGRVSTNENNITSNTNIINQITTSLENGNIMNYVGVWNSTTTYNLAQLCTLNDFWYVSNVDNNIGHQPTGASDAYWKLISAPAVNFNNYYTKQESDAKFATITTTNSLNTNKLDKSFLNIMFPVGSVVMTADGNTHALVNQYPSKFQELSDSDIAYLAIGNNSSNSNSTSFTIQQNQLPNISYRHNHNSGVPVWADDGCRFGEIQNSGNKRLGNYDGSTNGSARTDDQTFNLNGGVAQQAVNITIKPKTLKIRAWKVISNLV